MSKKDYLADWKLRNPDKVRAIRDRANAKRTAKRRAAGILPRTKRAMSAPKLRFSIRALFGLTSAEYRELQNIHRRIRYAMDEPYAQRAKARAASYQARERLKANARKARWHHARISESPQYRAICSVRARLNMFIRGRLLGKPQRSLLPWLGCDTDEFMRHMERQFRPGMSWANYGEWHVDHVTPLASAKSIADVERLAHFINLQPLWARDNLSKGAR